jgi:hypothetical protein
MGQSWPQMKVQLKISWCVWFCRGTGCYCCGYVTASSISVRTSHDITIAVSVPIGRGANWAIVHYLTSYMPARRRSAIHFHLAVRQFLPSLERTFHSGGGETKVHSRFKQPRISASTGICSTIESSAVRSAAINPTVSDAEHDDQGAQRLHQLHAPV